jgi:predicted outer membrane repeat protein
MPVAKIRSVRSKILPSRLAPRLMRIGLMAGIHRKTPRRTRLVGALLVALPGVLPATTVAVNDPSENSVPGKCALTDAVAAINTATTVNACVAGDGVNDTIDFSFFTTPATISFAVVPAAAVSAVALTKPAKISAPLDSSGNPLVTLARSTVSGTPNFRLIQTSSDLTVDGLAISSGSAPDNGGAVLAGGYANVVIANSVISGNTAATSGGGVAVDCGNLTLINSRISGNSASKSGGGIYTADDMYHSGSTTCMGTVTLDHSTLSGNTANTGQGGGAYLFKGYFSASHAVIDGNSAPQGVGGGVFAFGTAALSSSSVTNNTSHGQGGGVYGMQVKANSSTLTNNSSVAGKGGAACGQKYLGFTDSTVSDNSAGSGGAGYGEAATISFSTITGNHATDGNGGLIFKYFAAGTSYARFSSSIISGNAGNDIAGNSHLNIASSSHNIVGIATGVTLPLDTLSCDPQLGLLANNGGPTLTMAPAAGSCAINAGATFPPGTIASDQRGAAFARRVGVTTDIGAIEVQPTGERIFYDGFDSP